MIGGKRIQGKRSWILNDEEHHQAEAFVAHLTQMNDRLGQRTSALAWMAGVGWVGFGVMAGITVVHFFIT